MVGDELGENQDSAPPYVAETVQYLALVIGLPLLIAGWWYWRNFRLYGDPLMWDVTLAAKGAVIARTAPFTLGDLAEFASMHFQSYWLWFGLLNVKAPNWVYSLLAFATGMAVWGLLRLVGQGLGSRRAAQRLRAAPLLLGALATALIYLALLQYIQTINFSGYQGRLAFAAAVPIALFLALGWEAAGGRWLAQGMSLGLLLLSMAALPLIILPNYPRPQISQPAGELSRTCARFAGGLQVEGVQVRGPVRPGDALPVTVYGYGLHDIAAPQRLSARLVDRRGQLVAEANTSLTWQPAEVVSVTMRLPVAATAAPAQGRLEVGVLAADGAWQPATSATGRVLGVPVPVESVKIAPAVPFTPAPEYEVTAEFGEQLGLIGYDLVEMEGGFAITLYWQAATDIVQDYTTFVHVYDRDDRLVAHADGQPQDGVYPTSIWDVGEIVSDAKQISIPPGGLGSPYQIRTGVYLLATGDRLPVEAAQVKDNSLILPLPEGALSGARLTQMD